MAIGIARVVVGSLTGPVFLVGAVQALRWAYADLLFQQDTAETVAKAVAWAPECAEYRLRQAAYLSQEHPEGEQGRRALEAALRWNPRLSEAWLELAYRAETGGDHGRAEECLLKVAQVDRGFDPRWSLASYYFRRNRRAEFWRWAREAVEIGRRDLTPLFRLAWVLEPEPLAILERMVPDRPEPLGQYLGFLVGEERLGAALAVARRLGPRAGPEQAPVMLGYCDRLLEKGHAAWAVEIWNLLAARGLTPLPALDPERRAALVNGDFEWPISGRGFDWRTPVAPGVFVTQVSAPAALKVTFSGKQPEACRFLEQFIATAPEAGYELHLSYQAGAIPPQSGLVLRVLEALSGAELAACEPAPQQTEDWSEQRLAFRTSGETGLVRLVFEYRRLTGTPRLQGTLLVRRVRLSRLW